MLKDAALFIYFFHSSGVPICFLSIYKVPGAVPGILCQLSCVILIITLRLNNLPKVTLPGGSRAGIHKIFLPKGHKQSQDRNGCGCFPYLPFP